MTLTFRDTDGVRVVTATAPRIDAALAIQFKDDMRGLSGDGPQRVLLDMTLVEFIDSSGLGAIVAAMKQLAPERTLALACPGPAVSKVFRLTRMDTVFAMFQTVEEAIDALRT